MKAALAVAFRVTVVVGWVGLWVFSVLSVAENVSASPLVLALVAFLGTFGVLRVALTELASHDTELRFEPRDLWVGVFWDRRPDGLHVYVCLVPAFVYHVYPLIPARRRGLRA